MFGGADLVEFVQGHGDRARLTEDRNLEKTGVDGLSEIRYLFQLESETKKNLLALFPYLQLCCGHYATYQVVRLSNLVWGLFKSLLSRVDPAIAFLYILLHIAHVVEFKPPLGFLTW